MSANITDPSLAMSQAASQDLQAMQNRVQALNGGLSEEERQAKMRESCEGFEAIFLQNMWEQMRASLPQDGLMHSKEEQFWQGMYDEELAKSMASSGGIGLAEMMMEQMTRTDQNMGAASNDSVRRETMMPITPAQILPELPKQPAQSAERGTTNDPGAPVYDEDAWVQPQAPAAPDSDLGAVGQGLEQDPALAGVQTAPQAVGLISQTLDDLNELALAEQMQALNQARAELENMYAEIAEVQTGIRSDSAAMAADTAAGSRQPGSILTQVPPPAEQSAPVQAEADQSQVAEAQPQVVNFTYQTNLAPNARQASPLSHSAQAAALYRPQVEQTTVPAAAAAPIETAVLTAAAVLQPAPVQPEPDPAMNLPAGPEQLDVLAGISPRYLPSRLLASSAGQVRPGQGLLVADALLGSGQAMIQNTIQVGGQRLRGPEPVSPNLALGNPEPVKGSLAAPVDGEISSGFGWRLDPFTGQRAWHTGVDIKAMPGDDVRAAMAGTVIFAGQDQELGNLVIVEHADNLRTYYGHNAGLEVQVGDHVDKGMNIAQAGSSGRAAGVHLHFEVRRGDLALNPEPLLEQGREHYSVDAE